MGNYAREDGLEVTWWSCNCNVMRFLHDGNAPDSHVLRLIPTDGVELRICEFGL